MPNKPEYTRFLPHYHPIGATFFVTFRLRDSLPKAFLENLHAWYEAEKGRISKARSRAELEQAIALLQRDYFRKFDQALDQFSSGPTFLKDPAAARPVAEQLLRFDREWYHLLAYTVMPNQVHALLDFSAQLMDDGSVDTTSYKNLDHVMGRIKGASSRYINLALGRTGEDCWQPEYHDRYIRDKRHLLAAVDYIKQNVVSAKICLHWQEHPFTWIHEGFW